MNDDEIRYHISKIFVAISMAMSMVLFTGGFVLYYLPNAFATLTGILFVLAGLSIMFLVHSRTYSGRCRSIYESMKGDLDNPPLDEWGEMIDE